LGTWIFVYLGWRWKRASVQNQALPQQFVTPRRLAWVLTLFVAFLSFLIAAFLSDQSIIRSDGIETELIKGYGGLIERSTSQPVAGGTQAEQLASLSRYFAKSMPRDLI